MRKEILYICLALFTSAVAIAQVPSPVSPNKNPSVGGDVVPTYASKRIKITLTLSSLQDLKVREGDTVREGQILADRDYERRRLENQKRDTLGAIAAIEKAPRPSILPPPPLSNLPPISYAEEEAQVQSAELKFTQAQRNYQSAISGDPLVGAKAQIDYAQAEVEDAYRKVELQQRKLDAVVQLRNLPPEIAVHETEKLKQKRSQWEKAQADWEFKKAEYKQVTQQRSALVQDLANKVELARAELELQQAKLRTAKELRSRAEYEHRIASARQQEETNQREIASSNQNLERQYKLSQLKDQIARIEQQIAQLTQIRSPYNGKIKRIKTETQSNNTLTVVLSLVTHASSNFSGTVEPDTGGED